ncbi:hypothetical protein D3C79_775830 [compost metagenome]
MHIVDALEVIDIQEQQRQHVVVAMCGAQGRFQSVIEQRAVGQGGQRIVVGHEAQFFLGLAEGGHVPRDTDARLHLIRPEGRPEDVHDTAILADVTVAEIDVGMPVHDPDDGGPCHQQVVRMDVVGDRGADQLDGPVTEQGFTGITDKDNLVVPIDHEHCVQHQVDQPGIERLQVNGHRPGGPVQIA